MKNLFIFSLITINLIFILSGCNQTDWTKPNLKTSNQNNIQANSAIINEQVIEGDESTRQCIEKYKLHLTDGSFAKGTLIIGFKDKTSTEKAELLLQSYNLSSGASKVNSWTWKNVPGYLLVLVPANNELKWKCILEDNINIESVELNMAGTLH